MASAPRYRSPVIVQKPFKTNLMMLIIREYDDLKGR